LVYATTREVRIGNITHTVADWPKPILYESDAREFDRAVFNGARTTLTFRSRAAGMFDIMHLPGYKCLKPFIDAHEAISAKIAEDERRRTRRGPRPLPKPERADRRKRMARQGATKPGIL